MNIPSCSCLNLGPYAPCTCARAQVLGQQQQEFMPLCLDSLDATPRPNSLGLSFQTFTALPHVPHVSYDSHAVHDPYAPRPHGTSQPQSFQSGNAIGAIPCSIPHLSQHHRPPLQSTHTNIPAPQIPPPSQPRTRKRTISGQSTPNKRARTSRTTSSVAPPFVTSAICGVGPQTQPTNHTAVDSGP